MSATRSLIAAVVAAFGLCHAAFAADPADAAAPKTRAEVKAETIAAQQAKASQPGGVALPRPSYVDAPFVSTRSRAEVNAAAATAVARGDVPHGEVWRAQAPAAVPADEPTRAEVKAETRIAVRNGQIPSGEQGPYPRRS